MKIVQQDDVNFLLTNRLPRRLATRFIGWFSRIEQPLIRDASLAAWRFFADLDLSDAKQTRFRSMHDCFIRELKPGARPIDPDPAVLVSPCDAIVGACGSVEQGKVLQIKGLPYKVADLLGDPAHADTFRSGTYVTLRLTSSMYHRFHAPDDLIVTGVTHIGGDTWNVNPIALKRVERLFCRNERAVIRTRLARGGWPVALVPVAAILVAGIRLRFLDLSGVRREQGRTELACRTMIRRGEEMGWFEHGSTIILFAPSGFELCETVRTGGQVRVGQKLMQRPVRTGWEHGKRCCSRSPGISHGVACD
ncbi:archaetidylserine decarboxylase [Rhodopila sp.]|uniref:archaetidylserine decarboxylase n=1 Tax=Rhodopila sp. TaxID=2480087 RepID=UPI002CA50523|nr:archaetidylserine decarboxylase [Rhodopila sp.]HVZ09271.1 archaetidylserine decarboxylase [Rhodopila sp.]